MFPINFIFLTPKNSNLSIVNLDWAKNKSILLKSWREKAFSILNLLKLVSEIVVFSETTFKFFATFSKLGQNSLSNRIILPTL